MVKIAGIQPDPGGTLGIEESDVFTVEWVAVIEAPISWGGVISLECYSALLDSPRTEVIASLGGLKSRASLHLDNGECYLPIEAWRQVIITSLQALEEFVTQIMITELNIEPEEAREMTIGLLEALNDGCNIRTTDRRLN